MSDPQETLKPADPLQETAPNPAVSARDKAVEALARFQQDYEQSDPDDYEEWDDLGKRRQAFYLDLGEEWVSALEANGLVIVELSDIQRIAVCWGPTIATAKDFDLHIYERLELVCEGANHGLEVAE